MIILHVYPSFLILLYFSTNLSFCGPLSYPWSPRRFWWSFKTRSFTNFDTLHTQCQFSCSTTGLSHCDNVVRGSSNPFRFTTYSLPRTLKPKWSFQQRLRNCNCDNVPTLTFLSNTQPYHSLVWFYWIIKDLTKRPSQPYTVNTVYDYDKSHSINQIYVMFVYDHTNTLS